MMNAKRSNINAGWKYFMLAPLLVILVCGLNKQVATAGPSVKRLNTSAFSKSKAVEGLQPDIITITKMVKGKIAYNNSTMPKVDKVSKTLRDRELERKYKELKKHHVLLSSFFNNPKIGDPSIKPDLVLLDKELAKRNLTYSPAVLEKMATEATEYDDYPNIKKEVLAFYEVLQNIAAYMTSPAYLAKLEKLSEEDRVKFLAYLEKLGEEANRIE